MGLFGRPAPGRRGAVRPSGRGRRWRLLTARAAVAAVVLSAVVGLWTAWAAWTARADLLDARASLQQLDLSTASPDEVDRTLDEAAAGAGRARSRMEGLGPRAAAAVPVLGRSVDAVRLVAATSAGLLDVAERAWPAAARLRSGGAEVDLDAVAVLADLAEQGSSSVDDEARALASARLGGTPGSVRRAVAEAQEVLVPAASALRTAGPALTAVHGLLGGDGPRSIVLGVMNNAEVRGAGGYVPAVAEVRAQAGRVEVGRFVDTNELDDPPATARRVPAPPAFSARWGRYLADTTVWKNATMTAHGPDAAHVVCELARARPGGRCDAVVLVDVVALAEVMSLGGPVPVDGAPVSGDDLVEALLVEAYADAEDLGLAQAARRAGLLAAADAAVGQLFREDLTGLPALRLLGRSAEQRRLVVWSSDPDEQQAVERAGLAGSVDPAGADLSLVSLNQLSAGKLDYYLDRRVDVSVRVHRDHAEVTQRVRLALDHPDDVPRYVLGVKDGRLEHLVDLGLSAAAREVRLDRDGAAAPFALVPEDRGSARVATLSTLVDGQAQELVLRYVVPVRSGRYRLQLHPQPLVQDAALSVRIDAADGLRLTDGPVRRAGTLRRSESVDVQVTRPGWWDRPVELPW